MKHYLLAALAMTPAVICVGGAVYLAANGLSGWGWFLFVGCIIGGSYSYKEGR